MNAQQLKNAILQEAIEGRLVPQDPNDEPASALLDRTRKEKALLVKAGILKKKDLEETPITEGEKPFEIPESWEWCHLGEIVDMQMGKTPPRGDPLHWQNGKESWVSISDMKDYGHIQTTKEKISEYSVKKVFKKKSPQGTLLMSFKLTIGRTSILDIPAFHNEAIISIYPYVDTNDSFRDYLFYLLPLLSNLGDSKDAIKGKTLNSTSLNNLLIPLPPLAEQQRIVAKIEELLPKVEEYGKAQEALDKLNAELPERLKKSILQEAIEGRLVPQDPNDEPASVLLDRIRKEKAQLVKAGKLKKKDLEETPITEDEKPFEIPESWEWVRLNVVCAITNGFTPLRTEPLFWDNGTINWFTVEDIKEQGEIINYTRQKITEAATTKERVVRAGSVLLCCTASIGRCALTEIPITTNQQFNALTVKQEYVAALSDEYLFLFAKTLEDELHRLAGKTTFEFISVKKVGNIAIPLPPLAEQHRIVAKIDELLGSINALP